MATVAVSRVRFAPRAVEFNVVCLLATLLFWWNFLSVSRNVVWATRETAPLPTNALGYDWAITLRYHDAYEAPLSAIKLIFSFDKTSLMGNAQFPVSPLCFIRNVADPVTFAKIYLLTHVAIGGIGLFLVFRLFAQEYTPTHALAFVLFNFNGNISAHWFVGHIMWVSYYYAPLALYFLFRSSPRSSRTFWLDSAGLGTILALIFLTGGAHLSVWLLVLIAGFLVLDPFGAGVRSLALKVAAAGLTAVIIAAPKLVPTMQTGLEYWPPVRGGFQDLARLVAALLGHIDQTSETVMWWEGASYISIFPVLWYVKNLGEFGSWAHVKLMALAAFFALLSMDGVYRAVFGEMPILRSQHITSRLVLMSILLFAVSLATRAFEQKQRGSQWGDAYLIVMAYMAMTWRMWTITWDFDAPHY